VGLLKQVKIRRRGMVTEMELNLEMGKGGSTKDGKGRTGSVAASMP
jgi:hypothetical protein